MGRSMGEGSLKLVARARLQSLENIPSFTTLVDQYGLFCTAIKRDNFKEELDKLESFTDGFFARNGITDRTLQNQIAFKAFLTACSNLEKQKRKP